MNSKVKKPPVNIKELKKETGEEHKKGGLNYVDDRGPVGYPKSKVNITQLVLAVGLSILLFFVIAQFTLTSKSEAETLLGNQRILESNQASLGGKLATETGRIENIIAAQANYAQKTELASLSNSISNLVNQLGGFGSDIESLDSKIAALEIKVNNLTSSTGAVGGSYCYLTETKDGYDLTAKSSITGYYIARVTLVLETPWDLVGGVVGTGRYFIENMGYVKGEWKTVSISFYTGQFKLTAGQEKSGLKVPLNLSDEVEDIGYFAYVEILPSAMTTAPSGDVI